MHGATTIVLGAGASRAVSYAHEADYASPLDADFFDLLQRLTVEAKGEDSEAVESVLRRVRNLPDEYWGTMERAFYTLHLRTYLAAKLDHQGLDDSAETLLAEFARAVQRLLRAAHGKRVCLHHQ